MKRMFWVSRKVPFLAGLIALLSACTPPAGDPSSITSSELLERLGSEGAPFVLDVRTAREFESGHVPGAYHLEDRQCRTGSRS